MLKVSENPPTVYPESSQLTDLPGPWWVAHTKSRAEKVLAHMLCRWDIPYFLPLSERTTVRKGRHFKSLMPLFSGYLFFCGDREKRYAALASNKVANVIEVGDQARLVSELTQIHRALLSGAPIDPHPGLKKGSRCRVVAGSLMGLEGIVISRKNGLRLLLEVHILGQAAAVEIDADMLEPID
jgi:transcriptional antiterminator RfaH